MFLHSIDGLHTAVKQTTYYRGKGEKIKPILIDKVNFFMHSIIQGNMHRKRQISEFKPVPLHHKILRNMLGRYENEAIIELLQELDVIVVNPSYSKGVQSKKYGLTDTAKQMHIKPVGVLSKRMEDKIKKYKNDLLNYYLKDKAIHSKIIHNITNLRFNPDNPKAIQAMEDPGTGSDKAKYYKNTYQSLKDMNSYTDLGQYIECPNFYYMQSKKVKRVFHYYNTIPKAYRESLTLKDGTLLAEIDLKNSQPFDIGMDYLDAKNKHTESDKRLRQDLLNGEFYERIAGQALMNENVEWYNLFTDDYNEFKRMVLAYGLYFNYVPLQLIKPAERYLIELYPEFMNHIREKKRLNGYKSVSIDAQLIEANMFIESLYRGLEPGQFAVPVHDSLIVKQSEIEYFLTKLTEILRVRFPLLSYQQARDMFKVKNY